MGKRRKRLTMDKYANKYATKRELLGFNKRKAEDKMIEIDMTSGEEIKEEKVVEVVSNSEPAKQVKEDTPPWEPELQLEEVKVEEPSEEIPPPVVEAKKLTSKRTTRRKAAPKKTEE
jgi:methyl coenzyme M reductase gamma subunit